MKKYTKPLMTPSVSVYTWLSTDLSEAPIMPWFSSLSASSVFSTFSFQIKLPKILWSSCNFTASMLSTIPYFLQKKSRNSSAWNSRSSTIMAFGQPFHSWRTFQWVDLLLFFSCICCLELCTAVHVVSSAQNVFFHMSIFYPRLSLYTIFPMKHLLVSLSHSENPWLSYWTLQTLIFLFFNVLSFLIDNDLLEVWSWSHSSYQILNEWMNVINQQNGNTHRIQHHYV